MDDWEEKEIDTDFKPSTGLYIFLFIYYSIWLLQSFGAIGYYITYGFDSFKGFGLAEWLSFGFFIPAALYSVYAVIKTLRGDRDCIAALKWSLVLVFIYTLNDIRAQIPTNNIWVFRALYFARPLFYLIFYHYLCFSKNIKKRYPKSERRFGPSGWIWSGLTAALIGVGIYADWEQYQIDRYCRRVDVNSLALRPGEVSDGYVVFKSDRKWGKWNEIADTLYIDGRLETEPTIMSKDSTGIIYIFSGRCYKNDVRTYNLVIVGTLGTLADEWGEKRGKLEELSFIDTVFSGKRVMSTIFRTDLDSLPVYFDVAMTSELESGKCCVMAQIDKREIKKDMAVDFAKCLRFNLKNISKSKNDEKGENHEQ